MHDAHIPSAALSHSPTDTGAYQNELYAFLRGYKYRTAGWPHDQRVRDTGDYSKNGFNGAEYNGTHSAVVVYYSPEVYCWLLAGRVGAVPDGGMILKEMYPPPSARYDGQDVTKLNTPWWAIMVRDSSASFDGWYWGGLFDTVNAAGERTSLQPTDDQSPDEYPNSGFGQYCVRCHASARSQLTFASLSNIESGYDFVSGKTETFGKPIKYDDDGSWRDTTAAMPPERQQTLFAKHMPHAVHYMSRVQKELDAAKSEISTLDPHLADIRFVAAYGAQPALSIDRSSVQTFPPESLDRVPQAPEGHQFLTSDQCMGCHAGDNSPFGPNLFTQNNDVSPWGEWRWSMMGLAGRDPVFFAQLETETTAFQKPGGAMNPASIQNTCLTCHGVMGQRQFHIDNGDTLNFSEDEVLSATSHYGALARDGISCTVCHQMKDNTNQKLSDIDTGRFEVLPREDGKNQIIGPFDPVKTKPMEHALGATPMQHALGSAPSKTPFIQSSRLCASCHTIYLPILDNSGTILKKGYEQATYLEWENSQYRDDGSNPQSCQQCHMPDKFKGNALDFKIANIQDRDFPPGQGSADENKEVMLGDDDLTIAKRPEMRRHTLNGINAFSLALFDQFNDILGKRKDNYMSGGAQDLETTISNVAEFARSEVADVKIENPRVVNGELHFRVRVTNKTGHRFPSGVGFRRAFLEVSAQDSLGNDLWHSGATNSEGVIVDRLRRPLDTEFLTGKKYQHHHPTISSENDVQIYEELVQDSAQQFTTDFLKLVTKVKDNRLLPKGWSAQPSGWAYDAEALEATKPVGEAASDPNFTQGEDIVDYVIPLAWSIVPGNLRITAKLYYQAIPPSYLKQRFGSARGPATQRLYYMTSRLATKGTKIENWKLLISQDQQSAPRF